MAEEDEFHEEDVERVKLCWTDVEDGMWSRIEKCDVGTCKMNPRASAYFILVAKLHTSLKAGLLFIPFSPPRSSPHSTLLLRVDLKMVFAPSGALGGIQKVDHRISVGFASRFQLRHFFPVRYPMLSNAKTLKKKWQLLVNDDAINLDMYKKDREGESE